MNGAKHEGGKNVTFHFHLEKIVRSRLALALTLWGWLFPISLLVVETIETDWLQVYERTAFPVLIVIIPFVYTFLGYLVHERGKTLARLKTSEKSCRAVAQSLQLFRKTLETMQLGVTITDLQGNIIYSNPADAAMHGYTVEELQGKAARIFAADELGEPMAEERIKAMRRWRRESTNKRKDGTTFPVMLMSDVVTDADGNAVGVITTCEDITPRKNFEERIISLAHYDALTSLPNRYLFHDRMTRAVTSAHRYERMMAVLFTDLDHFKKINDTFGHGTGDRLLQLVADRLTGCVRTTDSVARISADCEGNIVARFGGDEFVILLSEIGHPGDATKIARRMLDALSRPFDIDERELFINASIGIALCPRDGADVETLMRHADMAMFCAKESGRNGFQFYNDSLSDARSRRYSVEGELRKALERDEFKLYYQPQVDIFTGEIIGFEALLRWVKPDSTVILPGAFIHIAEEAGLIIPIGNWAIRNACGQIKAWRAAGFDPVPVTVNISAIQFSQDGFVGTVSDILKDTEIDPRHLQLELTETTLMDRTEDAISKLGRLRAMGLGLSIDDFGTGYSSLNYLMRFPLTTLKIDQSFVKEVNCNDHCAAITKSIITLGHGLKLTVIAEGVETEEQLSFLCKNGCDGMQGFLISEPMDAPSATTLLDRRDPFRHIMTEYYRSKDCLWSLLGVSTSSCHDY